MNEHVDERPRLAGIQDRPAWHIQHVRELTSEEVDAAPKHSLVAAHARDRFLLFAILNRNFVAWDTYVHQIETVSAGFNEETLELNRLMSNYLSSARAVIDHFTQYYLHTYRRKPQEHDFEMFTQNLKATNWSYAFFQDFRNYVQHCGLPIGHFSGSSESGVRKVSIAVEAQALLKKYKGWEVSKLSLTHGSLNLVSLLATYHVALIGELGSFLANAFSPTLSCAHRFFADLHSEVVRVAPNHRAFVINKMHQKGSNLELTFELIPNDLFAELGFRIKGAAC